MKTLSTAHWGDVVVCQMLAMSWLGRRMHWWHYGCLTMRSLTAQAVMWSSGLSGGGITAGMWCHPIIFVQVWERQIFSSLFFRFLLQSSLSLSMSCPCVSAILMTISFSVSQLVYISGQLLWWFSFLRYMRYFSKSKLQIEYTCVLTATAKVDLYTVIYLSVFFQELWQGVLQKLTSIM